MQTIEKPMDVHVIKHMEERSKIIDAMHNLMKRANEEIWLSAWEEELGDLSSYAEERTKKGVKMFSLLFTDQERPSFGKSFYHRNKTSSIEKQRMGQRLTILIQDDKEVLIAGFVDGHIPQAIQTADPMLILLAKEYIRHDMMMKVVSAKLGNETLDSVWQGDDLLAYIVHGVK